QDAEALAGVKAAEKGHVQTLLAVRRRYERSEALERLADAPFEEEQLGEIPADADGDRGHAVAERPFEGGPIGGARLVEAVEMREERAAVHLDGRDRVAVPLGIEVLERAVEMRERAWIVPALRLDQTDRGLRASDPSLLVAGFEGRLGG